jgi:crotonobetainyl-CoA:carnitine CoA-transferase CaiB-like acyl-CoA transferase
MLLDGTPARAPEGAPRLGHHADAVLSEWLGYSNSQVDAIRAAGAMGKAA